MQQKCIRNEKKLDFSVHKWTFNIFILLIHMYCKQSVECTTVKSINFINFNHFYRYRQLKDISEETVNTLAPH
jgi:hypothetical protein